MNYHTDITNSPPQFIDTHCHLDFQRMGNIGQVLTTSHAANITTFVVPSVNYKNWEQVLTLSQVHSSIYGALGIHPYFIESNNYLEQLASLATLNRSNIVAIGEIGLDGTIDCPMDIQLTVLKPQLALAKSLNLPIICHAHKAYDLLLKQLRHYKLSRGGVIHGFSGSLVQAQEFLKLGFYLGVGGVITYERAQKTRRVFSQLPLESLLLETDSPDMPLSGLQGLANHPKNIPLIAQQLGLLLQVSIDDVARITTDNARKLFCIE
jgi:TatD DNase family protein